MSITTLNRCTDNFLWPPHGTATEVVISKLFILLSIVYKQCWTNTKFETATQHFIDLLTLLRVLPENVY